MRIFGKVYDSADCVCFLFVLALFLLSSALVVALFWSDKPKPGNTKTTVIPMPIIIR